ncbi:MAG: hypothetical protein IH978_10635 [Nitrospinae bacterium]|nr:hypothetical protein [Nitrospinota bacterium]
MSEMQTFWAVECAEGDPDFFVCMDCLNEVYRRKIPTECHGCGAISSFEPFALDSINDWGTEELIAKAQHASSEDPPPTEPSSV